MLNQVPPDVKEGVSSILGREVSKNTDLNNFQFSSGGCINNGGIIETSSGQFFIKWNDARKFPGMFEAEAKGLALLIASNNIRIPEVIGYAEQDGFSFLVLECINSGYPSPDYWPNFGRALANLHRNTSPQFGLDYDNYIGSLHQSNRFKSKWLDFFISERLEKQLKLAIDNAKMPKEAVHSFNILFNLLPELLNLQEPASLLHGDLWSGNQIADDLGQACLIDPAVYYGNREIELAFTQLFGGFDSSFYSAYDETFPIEKGFDRRVDLYNLYPLLVHVNLFGGGYISQVMHTLRRYQ
ncbi:MAG: fructosamine kinase family protein [Bacteroidota bacterium]